MFILIGTIALRALFNWERRKFLIYYNFYCSVYYKLLAFIFSVKLASKSLMPRSFRIKYNKKIVAPSAAQLAKCFRLNCLVHYGEKEKMTNQHSETDTAMFLVCMLWNQQLTRKYDLCSNFVVKENVCELEEWGANLDFTTLGQLAWDLT